MTPSGKAGKKRNHVWIQMNNNCLDKDVDVCVVCHAVRDYDTDEGFTTYCGEKERSNANAKRT